MISTVTRKILWSFLFGMTTGALMSISLKYPLTEKAIKEASGVCTANEGLDELKVGLSGKVYYVKCKDKKEFEFK